MHGGAGAGRQADDEHDMRPVFEQDGVQVHGRSAFSEMGRPTMDQPENGPAARIARCRIAASRGEGLRARKNCARISLLCCRVMKITGAVEEKAGKSSTSGGCSSVGRVPDCDSGCRGFESHQPPQEFSEIRRLDHSKRLSAAIRRKIERDLERSKREGSKRVLTTGPAPASCNRRKRPRTSCRSFSRRRRWRTWTRFPASAHGPRRHGCCPRRVRRIDWNR